MSRYRANDELHRDFHGTTDMALKYIAGHFGAEAFKGILREKAVEE